MQILLSVSVINIIRKMRKWRKNWPDVYLDKLHAPPTLYERTYTTAIKPLQMSARMHVSDILPPCVRTFVHNTRMKDEIVSKVLWNFNRTPFLLSLSNNFSILLVGRNTRVVYRQFWWIWTVFCDHFLKRLLRYASSNTAVVQWKFKRFSRFIPYKAKKLRKIIFRHF